MKKEPRKEQRGRTRRRKESPDADFRFLVAFLLVAFTIAVLLDISEKRQAEADNLLAAVDAVNQSNRNAGLDVPDVVLGPDLLPTAPVAEGTGTIQVSDTAAYNPEIPLTPEEQHALRSACNEFDIPVHLALGLIEKETGFRNISGDGGRSQGYMQVQRRWWSGLMKEIGTENLRDPEDNFRTGCAILRTLLDKYNGDVPAALTAYNAGRDTGSRSYASAVLRNAEAYQ